MTVEVMRKPKRKQCVKLAISLTREREEWVRRMANKTCRSFSGYIAFLIDERLINGKEAA
jgi:uncharacterized membrane protein